jgi:hypothetical protein
MQPSGWEIEDHAGEVCFIEFVTPDGKRVSLAEESKSPQT